VFRVPPEMNSIGICQSGNLSFLEDFLRCNEINDATNDALKHGRTLLHYAVYHEKIEFVKFLLQNGANAKIEDHVGYTPLDMAERRGCKEIICIFGDYNPINIKPAKQ